MKYLKEGRWEDFKIEKVEGKTSIEDINKNFFSEVEDCMVDLEEYLERMDGVYYKIYQYKIPTDRIFLISDMRDKLDDYIGKEAYNYAYFYKKDSGVTSRNFHTLDIFHEQEKYIKSYDFIIIKFVFDPIE